MLTYTGSRNLFGSLTLNTSSTNLTFGDTMINEGVDLMLGTIPWPFLETTKDVATVASQQDYKLPGNLYKLESVFIKVGTFKYSPTQVTSYDDWNRLNNPTGITSDTFSNYFLTGNTISFWPTPASSANTITFEYLQANRDMSIADYTTGTITTATNGSASIVGSGTTWGSGMVGHWLRITPANTSGGGDGLWYQISSVESTTALTLVRLYSGTSIAAGSASYTIGDCSLIPEKYQKGPVYYAAAEYFRKNGDSANADRYEQMYQRTVTQMINDEGTKTTSVVLDDGTGYNTIINPNLAKFT